ncbi:Nn.00g082430.m01.CDS01 [Neocucurbitaria sp. VM-36]
MDTSNHTQQPQNFDNQFKNVAIVGASGNVGSHIVAALAAKRQFNITAVSRAESTGNFPEGIKTAHVDYSNPDTIVKALRGQDVLIITMNVLAAQDTQAKLIRAAADAGVPWVLPSEYGMFTSEEVQNDTIGPGKAKDRELIEELGVSSWIGVVCGFWYEHSLSGPGFYGFDVEKREVVFFDEGTEKLNTSTFPQVGRAVASLLAPPVSSQYSKEGGPTLSDYRNRMVYVSSFAINQREMFESLKRVTGTTDSDWSITSVPAKQRYAEAKEKLKSGDRAAFGKVLYTRYFFPGEHAGLYGGAHGLDNEKLGLPEDDLDAATVAALKLGGNGYWNKYGRR